MAASNSTNLNTASQLSSTYAPGRVNWDEIGKSEHFVQFYDEDDFLIESVSAFIGCALGAGEGAIVIATEAHRTALAARFTENGLDLSALSERGQYVALDAADTLAKFMVNGQPDAALFEEVVGGAVRQVGSKQPHIRAFGEMVALLWAEGNSSAAIRLEELWNELGKTHSFSLFCAYPLSGFHGEVNGQPFTHICDKHSRVLPSESYFSSAESTERLRTVTLLQQKAASLKAEIAERKRIEVGLREEQIKLDMAIALTGLGTWELDLETYQFRCSDQCKLIFGVPSDAVFEYSQLLELVHYHDRRRVQNALHTAIANNTDYDIEYRIIDPDGKFRWIAMMGHYFDGDGGHRILGAVLDITERKHALGVRLQALSQARDAPSILPN